MKRDELFYKVKELRKNNPKFRNGRNVIFTSIYTEKGSRLYDMACRDEGYEITDVYKRPCYEMIKAYEKAYSFYCNYPASCEFQICSHNSYNFTCSWVSADAEVVFLTSRNEYHIIMR